MCNNFFLPFFLKFCRSRWVGVIERWHSRGIKLYQFLEKRGLGISNIFYFFIFYYVSLAKTIRYLFAKILIFYSKLKKIKKKFTIIMDQSLQN